MALRTPINPNPNPNNPNLNLNPNPIETKTTPQASAPHLSAAIHDCCMSWNRIT